MAEYVTVEQFVEHVEGNTETLKALLGLANSAYAMRGQIAALTCACSVAFRRIGAVEQSRLDEMRFRRLAGVPPMRKAALRVGVNQRDRAGPGAPGFHRQMP